MAPEVIQGTDYSLKADVFSYGIVLWEILARLPPYQGIPGLQLAFKVVNEGLRPTIPQHTDARYASFFCVTFFFFALIVSKKKKVMRS